MPARHDGPSDHAEPIIIRIQNAPIPTIDTTAIHRDVIHVADNVAVNSVGIIQDFQQQHAVTGAEVSVLIDAAKHKNRKL